MQGQNSAIQIALLLVANNLYEPCPPNIDCCIYGFRFIIEFTGNYENIQLLTAEILNSDWVLIPDASKKLSQYIGQIIEYKNIDNLQLLEQSKQIKQDNIF